jgi:hypothetical protein
MAKTTGSIEQLLAPSQKDQINGLPSELSGDPPPDSDSSWTIVISPAAYDAALVRARERGEVAGHIQGYTEGYLKGSEAGFRIGFFEGRLTGAREAISRVTEELRQPLSGLSFLAQVITKMSRVDLLAKVIRGSAEINSILLEHEKMAEQGIIGQHSPYFGEVNNSTYDQMRKAGFRRQLD